MRIFLDLGQEVLKRVENEKTVPAFIIASDSDLAINHSTLEAFFQKLYNQQPNSWYHSFDNAFEIPHTMLTTLEGNQYLDLLITVANAYLESDLTWDEVMKIANLMLQGNTFDTAVGRLGLALRVSPKLSLLLTIMDKKVIVNSGKIS